MAKVVLGGGDFLLWLAAYRELARKQAAENARNGRAPWNEDMLNGEGAFNDENQQARCPNEVLMQVRELARRAWKIIPKKGEIKHSLTKIMQGPIGPYADFVNRLMEAAGNIFETVDEAMPLVRRLAYEQANKTCREALRPWQHKDIPTFLKICRDVLDDVASGTHAAVAMAKMMHNNGNGRRCLKCGKEGHLKRECTAQKTPACQLGLCHRCRKGNHWTNECYSKMDKAGNPIVPNFNLSQKGSGSAPAKKWNGGPLTQGPENSMGAGATVRAAPKGTTGIRCAELRATGYTILTPQMGVQAVDVHLLDSLDDLEGIRITIGKAINSLMGLLVVTGIIPLPCKKLRVMLHSTKGIFLKDFGIVHLTGIPYNPQGQAIVERTHLYLKNLIIKQKGGIGEYAVSNKDALALALYTINFLNKKKNGKTPAELHSQPAKKESVQWIM
uniref:CCHC-type domain-containing protein n=1 Tax=Oryctolagus cuniculus TaxID=9986 RepID=A0A5F9D7F4_RABIT